MSDSLKGKLVILFIFGLALVAVVAALWYRYEQTRRTLGYWGPENAALLKSSAEAELIELAPPNAPIDAQSETLEVDGQRRRIVRRVDITRARGLVNVRNALTLDASYGWDTAATNCHSDWDYALRLTDGPQEVVLLLDMQCGQVRPLDGSKAAHIDPILDGLREFFSEQFPPAEPQASPDAPAKSPAVGEQGRS